MNRCPIDESMLDRFRPAVTMVEDIRTHFAGLDPPTGKVRLVVVVVEVAFLR
jgi:hypothetical protein